MKLKVNSELIGVKLDTSLFADFLGCKVGSLVASYVGCPLHIGKATKSLWNSEIERMERKLVTWKGIYLSCSHIRLIKAALANLPVYFMSKFNCSRVVINRIKLPNRLPFGRRGRKRKYD